MFFFREKKNYQKIEENVKFGIDEILIKCILIKYNLILKNNNTKYLKFLSNIDSNLTQTQQNFQKIFWVE